MRNNYYKLFIMLLTAGFLSVAATGCISEIAERNRLLKSYTQTNSYTMNLPDGENVVFAGWSEYKYVPGYAIQQGKSLTMISSARYEAHGNLEIYLASRIIANNPKYWKEWKNLTNNSAHDGCPAVSPDGTKVAFCSLRDGYSQVFIMDADGKNVKRLTNTPVDKINLQFITAGKVLFMTTSGVSFSGKTTREPQGLVVNIDGSGSETPFDPEKVFKDLDMGNN
jgi:Tol biopolymer transport system component